MLQNTGTGFENRPWPDPELDSVSPWPPARATQTTRRRILSFKVVVAGGLVAASTSIVFVALTFFFTAW